MSLLTVRGLSAAYPLSEGPWGARRQLPVLMGVDLDVREGEIVGLVGESGSGKTTLAKALLRLIEPTGGSVHFDGTDVLGLGAGQLRRFRRRMQIVFQDPGAALNPRMKVGDLVGEPLLVHGVARGRELRTRVEGLLGEVGLEPAAAKRYPREFSGGQRQRIGIARALALRPEFVGCDEPVSALDLSVQAQIVNLLVELQRRHGMAYLFIAHDLALIAHLCDRVVVMYLGRVVEEGPGELIRRQPLHPYTEALFAASPPPDPARARELRAPLAGEVPSPLAPPPGCAFHPRCPLATDTCRSRVPMLETTGPGRRVACHVRSRESAPHA